MNNVKTAALLATLGAVFVAVGAWLAGPAGAALGLVVGVGSCAAAYWGSDKIALRSARAVEVSAQQMPQLHHMTARLSERAGLQAPRLFVSPSPQPNAFATGRNEATAAICVTEGLLRTLDWGEIEGVLAHELAHVRHRDILIGSVAAAVAVAITFAAGMARFALIFAGGDGRRDNPLSTLLMVLLAPVAAALIQASISRSREFEADAAAARLLGTGAPLASALTKLERFSAVPSGVNPAEASAYIVNPLAGVSLSKLFSTHPPTGERVARLSAM